MALKNIGFSCLYRYPDSPIDILETVCPPRGTTPDGLTERMALSIDRADLALFLQREETNPQFCCLLKRVEDSQEPLVFSLL
jgi:hypothetical protein